MAVNTILIIDPDSGVAQLLRQILEMEGYRAAISRSLEEATRLMSDSHFDLIITEAFDQRSVFDFDPTFLVKLRSLGGDTPIIVFSSYVPRSRLKESPQDQARFVQKPSGLDILPEEVGKLLP